MAIEYIRRASERSEVGLGFTGKRKGNRVGEQLATDIVSLFMVIPQIRKHGLAHIEEIKLYVDQVAGDRISDITCTFLKSFLIDHAIE